MILTNGQLTGYMTLSEATRRSIPLSNGRVTVTYGLAENLWLISRMDWDMMKCSPGAAEEASTIIRLEQWDWMFRGFSSAYYVLDLGPVQMASAWVFTTSRDRSSGGGVSPCTESTVGLLIGHGSFVTLTRVVWGRTDFGFVFVIGCLLVIHVCGSPWGLLLMGG